MNKRKSRPAASFGYYLVEIADWHWSYNFGLVSERFAERHFEEYRHLRVRGRLACPKTITCKAVELIFLPDVRPEDLVPQGKLPGLDDRPPPGGVGSLHLSGKTLIGHLELPKDALDPVLQMLQAGRLHYVALDGQAIRYNKCMIRHYEIKERDEKVQPDGR